MDRIPSLYLYLHERLIEICNGGNVMSYHLFKKRLSQIRVKKCMVLEIIREFEVLGLIEKVNKQNVRVIKNGIQETTQGKP